SAAHPTATAAKTADCPKESDRDPPITAPTTAHADAAATVAGRAANVGATVGRSHSASRYAMHTNRVEPTTSLGRWWRVACTAPATMASQAAPITRSHGRSRSGTANKAATTSADATAACPLGKLGSTKYTGAFTRSGRGRTCPSTSAAPIAAPATQTAAA